MDEIDVSIDDFNDPLVDVSEPLDIPYVVNPVPMIEDDQAITFEDFSRDNAELQDHPLAGSSSLGSITGFYSKRTSNTAAFMTSAAGTNSLTDSKPRREQISGEYMFPNGVSKTKDRTSARHQYNAANRQQSIVPHTKATEIIGLERGDDDEYKIIPGEVYPDSTGHPRFQIQSIRKSVNGQGKISNPLVEQGKLEEFLGNGGTAATETTIKGTALECTIDKHEMMLDEEVSNAIFQNATDGGIQDSLVIFDWDVSKGRARGSGGEVKGAFGARVPANWISEANTFNTILPSSVVPTGSRKATDISTNVVNLASSFTGSDSSHRNKTHKAEKTIGKKRKMSKREAARAKSAADQKHEDRIVRLAKDNKISEDELLRLKPKKQRRAAKFDKPVASRFCHICSRTPKNVRLAVCSKIKLGTCRKVICEKCFDEYELGKFDLAANTPNSSWACTHCSATCPARAQCRTYQRINDRLRANRLKQERPRSRRRSRRGSDMEDEEDVAATCQGTQTRFLLPAPLPTPVQPVTLVQDAAYIRHTLVSTPDNENRSSQNSAIRPPGMPGTPTEIPSSPSTPTLKIKVPLTFVVGDASQETTAEVDNEVARTVLPDAMAMKMTSPIGSDDVNLEMDMFDDIIDMPAITDEGQDLVLSMMGTDQREGLKQEDMELSGHDMEDF